VARRYYSSSAASTTLTSSVTNAATGIVVGAITGFPVAYPYTLILDPETSSEEVVSVTAGTGVSLTVTRGVDGTVALAHTGSAPVKHGVSARDFDEPNAHIDATVGHGATGAVVGTSNTQTLTNKTHTDPVVNQFGAASGLGAGWTAYTPVLTATTADPTLGAGSVQSGWYKRIGKTVHFVAAVRFGTSGILVGTGSYFVSLPVAAHAANYTFGGGNNHVVGSGMTVDDSTTVRYPLVVDFITALKVSLVSTSSNAAVSHVAPFAWAVSDGIKISGTYEAA